MYGGGVVWAVAEGGAGADRGGAGPWRRLYLGRDGCGVCGVAARGLGDGGNHYRVQAAKRASTGVMGLFSGICVYWLVPMAGR